MDPLACPSPAPQRCYEPSSRQPGTQAPLHDELAACSRPTLCSGDYMAELNERLRCHPMYLQGMHFPQPQPGSTPMLAAALAWEGPWDCLGVFTSVLDDVARDYALGA